MLDSEILAVLDETPLTVWINTANKFLGIF